ncbi:MAG TPA: AMP-binding protein [Actinomycetota bacterium]|nr:AMP-binding protein [Actinomycetota bacterium]
MSKQSWDALDQEDLARLRDKKLRRQVRFQLYAYSPFYRRVFDQAELRAEGFNGLADLQKVPTIGRSILAEDPEGFVLNPERSLIQRWGSGSQLAELAMDTLLRGVEHADDLLKNEYQTVHVLETTGTTGEPIPVSLSRRDLAVLATQGRRALEVAGVGKTDVVLNLMEPSSAGGFWPLWLGGVALGIKQNAPGFLEPQQAAALASKMKASVVLGTGEDVLEMLEVGLRLESLRKVVLGPQSTGPVLRRRIQERSSGVQVIATYGFAEGRSIWAECAAANGALDSGFHLSGDLDLFEVISPRSGKAVKAGDPGELHFTGLDQRGTALMRYRPGDVAMGGLRTGRCPYCGRMTDRIIGPIRRAENLLEIQPAGSEALAIDVEMLADVLSHPGLANWQVEVGKSDGEPRGPDELYVLFEPRSNVDASALVVDLDQSFRSEIGFSPTQFVLSDRAKGGVVDLRPILVNGQPNSTIGGEETPLVRLWRTPVPQERDE